jgi:hypothetical protein
MVAVNEHPPALWAAIRRAYEGRDPARRTSQEIAGEVLAEAFGVHANSIFNRAKARAWVRPAWYEKGRGPRKPKRSAYQERRARLIAVLRQAATLGQPCPGERALKESVCISGRTVRQMLTDLRRDGTLTVEYRDGYSRRAVFADGSATGWSNPKRGGAVIPSDRPRAAKARPGARPRRGRASTPPGGIDLPVTEATRAMRRAGRHVFDTGVLHGRWRERWSIDGKIVDRAGLLLEAAHA